MKLNQRVKYAIQALYELSKESFNYVDTEQIASRQNIPLAYAHKVLQLMAHAGLVYAVKGLGYKLSRPLNTISALNVLESLKNDGPSETTTDLAFLFEKRVNKALESVNLSEVLTGK